jgi:SRSO17 transposase
LDAVLTRIGPRFTRSEPRMRVGRFVMGLLAGLSRTTCWSIAEHAGENDPRGMQRLLAEAVWDTDGVRDDLRSYVAEHLNAPDAVLIVDETGDLKKGTHTVGVQRQYSGTAGRIENCQIAVYLTYATARGYTLIDHALYLPQSWTEDAQRMKAAGVPEDVEFATKPAQAAQMITRALDAGVEAAWVTGDEVYGNASTLRADIAERGLGFVMAIAKTHPITTGIGTRHAVDYAVRPALRWHRYSAGDGAHGPRLYDWAWIDTTDPALTHDNDPADDAGHDWLLIRRNIRTGELAFYRAHATHPVTLKTLVRVAGSRWRIEDSFAGVKELAALDHHQVRTWTSWHRWSLLAMLAHAILAVLTAHQDPAPTGLIPLTRHEIRRLLNALSAVVHSPEHIRAWSIWRRDHQATARTSHYRRTIQEP